MSKRYIIQIAVFALLVIMAVTACGNTDHSNAVPAITQTQFEPMPENIRDYRYCEIVPVFRSGTALYIEVYNTIGLNDCPTAPWNALDEESMVEEYDAMAVILNGPRYWVINEVTGRGDTLTGKVVDFNGIEMKLGAVIETQLSDGAVGESLYTDNEVQRSTTYTYYAGDMVYELTAPNGDVYRMQSYAQIVDPTLTIDDLPTLGARLSLPEGWSYQARILEEDVELTADGLAYVINDDLGSSYQKVTDTDSSQSQAPAGVADQLVPSTNDTGIYTTVTAFEHGDTGRQHVFNAAVFTGDLNDPSLNQINSRTTPQSYPGIYNVVTRHADELFVYFGNYGDVEGATGPTLARLNANSLEEDWRTSVAEITPPSWNYPGVVGLHGNGYLYVVGGNIIAKIDPDSGELLNTTTLPSEKPEHSSYNGFAVSSNGTIFAKPVYRTCDEVGGKALLECADAETPSVLTAVDPETLEIIDQLQLPEPVFGRLIMGTHHGVDYIYTQGVSTLSRYRWQDGTLALDEDWSFTTILSEGQVGAASPSISEDWLFFQTNGLPSTDPMSVWAVSTNDPSQYFSIDPFADLTEDESFNISKGSFDYENSRAYVVDAFVGQVASLHFDPTTGFEIEWREPQTSISYHTLVNPAESRVIVMSDITGLGSRISPFLAQSEQLVFRNGATGEELARTEKLPRMVGGANITPGFNGRFYYPASDGKLYEITISVQS